MAIGDGNRDTAPMSRWMRFSLGGLLFFVLCVAGILVGARVGQRQIRLNPNPLQMTIAQRSSLDVPGLRGLANIGLEDITDDQVLLSVKDDQGSDLLAPTSVRKNDTVSFPVQGQTFYVRVTRLVNNLVGEDFGILEVSTQKAGP